MPIMVDGNNLLHRLPANRRSRGEVRRLTLALARREGIRITLVFDGPPPAGTPDQEALGGVKIVYSGRVSADDTIIRRLPGRPRSADWVVVSADRGLLERARRAGAKTRPLDQWIDKLMTAGPAETGSEQLSPDEVAEWEEYFAGGSED